MCFSMLPLAVAGPSVISRNGERRLVVHPNLGLKNVFFPLMRVRSPVAITLSPSPETCCRSSRFCSLSQCFPSYLWAALRVKFPTAPFPLHLPVLQTMRSWSSRPPTTHVQCTALVFESMITFSDALDGRAFYGRLVNSPS